MLAVPSVSVHANAMCGFPWASQKPEMALSSQAVVAHFVGVRVAAGLQTPALPGLTQVKVQLIGSGLMQSASLVHALAPPGLLAPPGFELPPVDDAPPRERLPPVEGAPAVAEPPTVDEAPPELELPPVDGAPANWNYLLLKSHPRLLSCHPLTCCRRGKNYQPYFRFRRGLLRRGLGLLWLSTRRSR
jgi:hypothetical protein